MAEYPIDFCIHLARAIRRHQKTATYKPLSSQQLAQRTANKPVTPSYGQIGDVLWMREPWGTDANGATLYQADYAMDGWHGKLALPDDFVGPTGMLPRERARSLLTVVTIDIVDLQVVDEAAAKAAGTLPTEDRTTYLDEFKAQWDDAYRKQTWATNPLCWRVTYTIQ
jgi:hypothetical protein